MTHKIIVNLNVFSSVPLYHQFAEELRRAIRVGTVRAGEKLPSIRELAKQLQISTITVRESIDRLIQEGLIQARQGSGNFVAGSFQPTSIPTASTIDDTIHFSQAAYESSRVALDDSVNWSRECKNINRAFNDSAFHPWWDLAVDFDFRVYQPPTEPFEGLHWDAAVSAWGRHYVTCPDSGRDARGLFELRVQISDWLNRTRHLGCRPEDLMIVAGAQEARDLVARMLVEDGRQVVFEEPCSITDALAYTSKGAELVMVPEAASGIDIAQLDSYPLATAAHIISTASFPSGLTMSLENRKALLEWASLRNVVIVEDAYGSGFVHEAPIEPTLYQMAKSGKHSATVIYLGSLSQLVNPALRLGFVLLPKQLHKTFVLTKWLAERHTSLLSQQLALKLMAAGEFDEDCLRVTQAARSRRKAMQEALKKWPQGLASWTPVKAGLQQPIWFEEGIDDLLVFERALAAGVGVIPISPYYRGSANTRHGLSLSFFQMSESKIEAGLARLLQVILSGR